MKKLQFLLVFTFLAAGLNAQTRSETLRWLSDKINLYNYNEAIECSSGNYISHHIHKTTCDTAIGGGIGAIYFTGTYSDGTNSRTITMVAFLNDITNVTIEQNNNCTPLYKYINLVFKPKTLFWRDQNGGIGRAESLSLYLKWDSEEDLLNRMVKAFRHLIDLQKPKEIF